MRLGGRVCARFINQFRGLCFARKKIPPLVLLLRADWNSRLGGQGGGAGRGEGQISPLETPHPGMDMMVVYSLQRCTIFNYCLPCPANYQGPPMRGHALNPGGNVRVLMSSWWVVWMVGRSDDDAHCLIPAV